VALATLSPFTGRGKARETERHKEKRRAG